jgi:hypothetical protein
MNDGDELLRWDVHEGEYRVGRIMSEIFCMMEIQEEAIEVHSR